MRWRGERESSNVEDQRGSRRGLAVGGGIGTIVILVIALLFGADPRAILDQLQGGGGAPAPATRSAQPVNPEEEELKRFSSVVLASTEDVWTDILRREGI